jgi:predicted ArsR family transcriptional regulator
MQHSSKLRQALIRLQSISDNLPDDDVDRKHINDYHGLLDIVQAEIGEDLSGFRIPHDVLVRHFAGLSWEGAYHGWQTKESEDLYCPRNDFLIAIRGALRFIDECLLTPRATPVHSNTQAADPQQSQESGVVIVAPEPTPQSSQEYKPNEQERRILIFLNDPRMDRVYEVEVSNKLKLPFGSVQSSLNNLERKGYVHLYTDRNNQRSCSLADKGKKYFTEPDYRGIPHPAGGEDRPNEVEEKILILLATPQVTPFFDSISITLGMNPTILKYHLTELAKRDYVNGNVFDEWGSPRFSLTQKARKFLVENNLIK